MGGFRIQGLREFKQRIRKNIVEQRQNILLAAEDIGDVAVYGAVQFAPVDKGILVAYIEKSIQPTADTVHIVIRVPLNSPASDYAVPMHEDYYNLGEDSKKKAARTGLDVGRKYIEKGVKYTIPQQELILQRRLKK